MNRSILHQFKNEFSGSFDFAFTTFSGAASLVGPGAGKHLRVYNVVVDGPSGLGAATTVELQDGSASPIWAAVVDAGSHREMNLLGRYWKVDTAVRFTRAGGTNDAVHVGVWYREVDN